MFGNNRAEECCSMSSGRLRKVQTLITLVLCPASLALAPRRPSQAVASQAPGPSLRLQAARTRTHTGLWAAMCAAWLSSKSSPFSSAQWGQRCPPSSRSLTRAQHVGTPGTCPLRDGRAACELHPGT